MAQASVYLATQVFEIVSQHNHDLHVDETSFQIAGLAYQRFEVGEILYLDVDFYLNQVPVRVLKIEFYGHLIDQIDPGLSALLTMEISPEAAVRRAAYSQKHLYRLELVSSVPHLNRGQMMFIPPHLL